MRPCDSSRVWIVISWSIISPTVVRRSSHLTILIGLHSSKNSSVHGTSRLENSLSTILSVEESKMALESLESRYSRIHDINTFPRINYLPSSLIWNPLVFSSLVCTVHRANSWSVKASKMQRSMERSMHSHSKPVNSAWPSEMNVNEKR